MNPGDCPFESSNLDGKKSHCTLTMKWTDCREVGHCTSELEETEIEEDE